MTSDLSSELLPKNKFLSLLLLLSAGSLVAFAGFNYYTDVYGLFRGKENRTIYINERTSKYLLSYRYIPSYFDGVLFGPSLSANLNTKELRNCTVYNASIMGANVTETDLLVDNICANGHMKLALICLDPYLTKDFGRKGASMDPKEYWGALGSTNLVKTYLFYAIRHYKLRPQRFSPVLYNEYGWNNYEAEMQGLNSRTAIQEKMKSADAEKTTIHPEAYNELGKMLDKLRQHQIKVIAYFSPVPYQLRMLNKEGYAQYQSEIGKLFAPEDVLLNLNDERYKTITSNYDTYIDHGHLSSSGQRFVLGELQKAIDQALKN